MERVILVGGGKVAYFLIRLLAQEKRYEMRLVEKNPETARRIAEAYGLPTFVGDGTNTATLEKAGARDAAMLIALTGLDEDNLLACQLAKVHFHVGFTVARVNNPRNGSTLRMLGVDKIYSGTELLARLIGQQLAFSGIDIVYNISGTTKAVVSCPISPESAAVGMTLNDFSFSGDTRVVMLTRRSGEALIPIGQTRMEAGDTLLLICDEAEFASIGETFVRPRQTESRKE